MAPKAGLQSFLDDMAAFLRRKKEDAGRRSSLFEAVPPGNVGNVFDIAPSQLQFADTFTEEAYGTPVRVLDISGDDALGEMICVSLAQERVVDDAEAPTANAVNDVVEGPLVGIVEFGAGAGLSTFEFDIPAPGFTPGFVSQTTSNGSISDSLLVSRRVNGSLLTLPASSLRILVRNDANAPYLLRGLGGDPTATSSLNSVKNPAKVRVHATYGRRPFPMTLTRSIPICLARSLDGTGGPTDPFAPGNQLRFTIPAYARRVSFPRFPMATTSLTIRTFQSQLKDNGVLSFSAFSTVMMGSPGPIELSPFDTFIELNNPSAVDIENMHAVFELSI